MNTSIKSAAPPAVKSHRGRKTPGFVDPSLTALIVSFCDVKYDCSVSSPLLTVAGTPTPFWFDDRRLRAPCD